MSIVAMLDKLFFGPLLLFFDLMLSITQYTRIDNVILLIALLCLMVNLPVFALWRKAEAFRGEPSRSPSAKSGGQSGFPGAVWRQIRDSLPLLVDIPFLIAAYRYLSGMEMLQGVSCWRIDDMSAPDALARVSGHALNLLPVALTLVGMLAVFIYTRGRPLKDKVIGYAKVAVSLALLYRAPASVTLYWTVNNLMWLCVVVLYRIAGPQRVFAGMCSALGLAILCFTFFNLHVFRIITKVILLTTAVILQLPLGLLVIRKCPFPGNDGAETQNDRLLFCAACAFLTLFTGALIPLNVIQSSPEEFVDISNFHTSLRYVLSSTLLAAGTFLVWPSVFYRLTARGRRKYWGLAMIVLSAVAVVDYLFFGNGYGLISTEFIYESVLPVLNRQILVNLLVVLAVVLLVLLAWKKGRELLRIVASAACLGILAMSIVGAVSVQNSYGRLLSSVRTGDEREQPSFPLDKSGKNVMVVMLDRAMGRLIPYIMQEKPELQQRFSGFTYYANTLSYGSHTNVGSPGLFGGYDYTPLEMTRRSDELLADKHNEALKLMPVLFLENGYDVTVCDPPYAGYKETPDLSIYDEWPEINAYITRTDDAIEDRAMLQHCDEVRDRNFFCYSVFRSAPVVLHKLLYDGGQYNKIGSSWTQTMSSLSRARGMDYTFMKNYSVLTKLPEYTNIRDEGRNTFMMIDNCTSHESTLLQEPDYTPAMEIDNTAFESGDTIIRQGLDGTTLELTTSHQVKHYHVNMAALLKMADWFDYMRENGVYDNTRIILVSDHGFRMDGLFGLQLSSNKPMDMHYFCPLLMVKDFGSTGFTVDDSTFMTNADTPLLALEGLVENPVNPFTGKALSDATKYLPEQLIAFEGDVRPYRNNGYTFKKLTWYANSNDIFDPSAWRYVGTEPEG